MSVSCVRSRVWVVVGVGVREGGAAGGGVGGREARGGAPHTTGPGTRVALSLPLSLPLSHTPTPTHPLSHRQQAAVLDERPKAGGVGGVADVDEARELGHARGVADVAAVNVLGRALHLWFGCLVVVCSEGDKKREGRGKGLVSPRRACRAARTSRDGWRGMWRGYYQNRTHAGRCAPKVRSTNPPLCAFDLGPV